MRATSTRDAFKSAGIAGAIGFLYNFSVVILSLLGGSVYASVLGAFPVTLVIFAISSTISKEKSQEDSFDRFLLLSAALYVFLSILVIIWWIVNYFAFQQSSWTKRIWTGFGISIIIWVISAIALLTMYFSNKKWHDFLSEDEK
jgi:hypothetical protein